MSDKFQTYLRRLEAMTELFRRRTDQTDRAFAVLCAPHAADANARALAAIERETRTIHLLTFTNQRVNQYR